VRGSYGVQTPGLSSRQAALEGQDVQAGDAVEVTGVVRADCIPKFQSARAEPLRLASLPPVSSRARQAG
jgi:hypothetical protein